MQYSSLSHSFRSPPWSHPEVIRLLRRALLCEGALALGWLLQATAWTGGLP